MGQFSAAHTRSGLVLGERTELGTLESLEPVRATGQDTQSIRVVVEDSKLIPVIIRLEVDDFAAGSLLMMVCEVSGSFPLLGVCAPDSGAVYGCRRKRFAVGWACGAVCGGNSFSHETLPKILQCFVSAFLLIVSLLSPFYRGKEKTKIINNTFQEYFGFCCRELKNTF